MIEKLAHALHALRPDVSFDELRDVLWLAGYLPSAQAVEVASRRPAASPLPTNADKDTLAADSPAARQRLNLPFAAPTRAAEDGAAFAVDTRTELPIGRAARRVRLRGPEPLADPLGLARALRPLGRRREFGPRVVLDEVATAERIAQTGLAVPVLRPRRERWFDIVLVVEQSPGLAAWRPQVRAFQRLLQRHGGFRRVESLSLSSTDPGAVQLTSTAGTAVSAVSLLERYGRRVIIVVSDCTSPGWHDGSFAEWLQPLTNRLPIAVAQPFDPEVWSHTALGFVELSTLAMHPGAPNSALRVKLPAWARGQRGLVLPVFAMRPESASAWARMLMARGDAWAPAALLPRAEATPEDPVDTEIRALLAVPPADSASDTDLGLLEAFRAAALPAARRLAAGLAVVEPLTLPVMRLVQHTLAPEGGAAALAQVLACGLFRPSEPLRIHNEDTVTFQVMPAVRKRLEAGLPRSQWQEVMLAIGRALEEETSESVDILASIDDPLGQDRLPPSARPFAEFARQSAHRFRRARNVTSAGQSLAQKKNLESATKSSTPDPTATLQPERWVDVALEDTASDEILRVGATYTLAVSVDVARHQAVATAGFAEQSLYPEEVDEVAVTVQLDSNDFQVEERRATLRIRRAGAWRDKARFEITPLHDGASTITVTLLKDDNFLQNIVVTFTVASDRPVRIEATARGRPPSAASVLKPRDVGISLSPAAGGYDCIVWGEVAARARLPLQPAYLASAIDELLSELMKVLMHHDARGEYVFQTGIDIAAAERDFALATMARAGARLFQRVFFGPAAGPDSKSVGNYLREVAGDRKRQLRLQVVAETAPIPWGLLYIGDAGAGAQLDWDSFIGMRHIIEEIPLQTTMAVVDNVIASEPQLAVGINVNTEIDTQLGITVVADQQAWWSNQTSKSQRIRVTSRTRRAELLRALADPTTADQILYFYCHAQSAGPADPGGPDASTLGLSDGVITLGELALDAPTSIPLPGRPLVFINATESAQRSPTFYDGFVRYFIAKGARGVIGTEAKIPALFAARWAERFFERFLNGDALGDIFLELRREFLEQHGNPLGLLYAVHCDGDTRIEPAVR
jgi:hypothetical protein